MSQVQLLYQARGDFKGRSPISANLFHCLIMDLDLDLDLDLDFDFDWDVLVLATFSRSS
jgi:hypothetical protein